MGYFWLFATPIVWSSQLEGQIQVSLIAGRFFTNLAIKEAHIEAHKKKEGNPVIFNNMYPEGILLHEVNQ